MKEPLLERLHSLEIDHANKEDLLFSILPWTWRQSEQAFLGAIGNFGVQYNIFVTLELCFLFEPDLKDRAILIIMLLMGMFFGTSSLGSLADAKGREVAMLCSLTAMIVGAFSASASFFSWGSTATTMYMLYTALFLVGFGCGGFYPVFCASSAEEWQDFDHTQKSVHTAKGYFWQLPGSIFLFLVSVCLYSIPVTNDMRWRTLFAIGGCFPLFVMYKISRTEFERNLEYEAFRKNMDSFCMSVFRRPNLYNLVITTSCCFLYDSIFYGIIFSIPEIVNDLWPNATFENRVMHFIIPFLCAMPMAIATNYFILKSGTRITQMWGFVAVSIISILLSSASFAIVSRSFTMFMMLLLFCSLWVPNLTTYVILAESFTPEIRATLTGCSMAFGKCGAICGFYCFQSLLSSQGLGACFLLTSGAALLGGLITKAGIESEDDRSFRCSIIRKVANAHRRTVTILTDVTEIEPEYRSYPYSSHSLSESVQTQGDAGSVGKDADDFQNVVCTTGSRRDGDGFEEMAAMYGGWQSLTVQAPFTREQSIVFEEDGDMFAPLGSGENLESALHEQHPWIANVQDVKAQNQKQHGGGAAGKELEVTFPIVRLSSTENWALDEDNSEKLQQTVVIPSIMREKATLLLHREGAEEYVPFFVWQRSTLNWIHENFNHPLFRQWNYLWHLVPKTPVQLMLHSFILGIGPGTVTESFYIIILGHVLWSGPWLIKDFFQVPRPSWVLPFGFSLTISERNWSFPSGHTMGLSGTFLLLALIFGDQFSILWLLYVVMTVLTCLARTALRMHWPLDTFGSCIMAPLIVIPLYFKRDIIFHNHIHRSVDMLTASVFVFSLFFFTHALAHIYVQTYLPIPSIVSHIASDPQKFKYTNVMGGMRNSLFLLGVGLGIYTVWEIRDPGAKVCPFDTGLQPALMAIFTTGVLLLIQNFVRNWSFQTMAWTSKDYYIKFLFAPLIGYITILNAAGVLLEFKMAF